MLVTMMGRTMTVPSSKLSNSLLISFLASSNTFAVESPIVHIFVPPDSLFPFSGYSLSNTLFSETLEWVFGVTLSKFSQSILKILWTIVCALIKLLKLSWIHGRAVGGSAFVSENWKYEDYSTYRLSSISKYNPPQYRYIPFYSRYLAMDVAHFSTG